MDSLDHLYTAGHEHLSIVQHYVETADGFQGLSPADRRTVHHHLKQSRSILELAVEEATDFETLVHLEDLLYRIDAHLTTVSK